MMTNNVETETSTVEAQPAAAPTVTLTMDINELNVVVAALQELPHRVVDVILKKLIQQAQEQLQT
jgi:hypothetical protein